MRPLLILAALLGPNSAAFAATLVVDTTSDVVDSTDGVLSFREALLDAVDGDDITFDVAVFPSAARTIIAPTSSLPSVHLGVDVRADDRVALDGSATTNADGLVLEGGNVVVGLEIKSFDHAGIVVVQPPSGRTTRVGGLVTDEAGGLSPNVIHGNGGAGIKLAAVANTGVIIDGNRVGATSMDVGDGNCQAPAGACAGVLVDPMCTAAIQITGNLIVDTRGDPSQSQGSGVLVQGGAGHEIVETGSDSSTTSVRPCWATPVTAFRSRGSTSSVFGLPPTSCRGTQSMACSSGSGARAPWSVRG